MEEVWRKERDAWHRQKEDLKVLVVSYLATFNELNVISALKFHHFFPANLLSELKLNMPFLVKQAYFFKF